MCTSAILTSVSVTALIFGSSHINNYLLTDSEVFTGKSQTKTLIARSLTRSVRHIAQQSYVMGKTIVSPIKFVPNSDLLNE